MKRTSCVFLVLVSFALFVVTYNTASMIVTYRSKLAETGLKPVFGGGSGKYFDPLVKMPDHLMVQRRVPEKKRLFHVVVTANESKYNKWQCRIMYYWFKKFKDHPDSEMGGFTRLLHSGKSDNVMDEIPTFVVDPLPPGEDRGYVVLNRPWAFVQWLEKATIEEEYILMAEPDHIMIRPLPNLATGDLPAAFPFFYIEPKENEEVLRKFFPAEKGPITNIDPIGNSPVIIKQSQLKKIAPTWLNTSIAMKDDPQADQKFGWVLEMYGYATASAYHGVQHILRKDFMLQPPWDTELSDRYIIHYTYGCDYTLEVINLAFKSCRHLILFAALCFQPPFDTDVKNGYLIHYSYGCDYTLEGNLMYGKIGQWRFDKRSFTTGAPPRNLPLPPAGVPITVVTLVNAINEATENIPNWVEGD